MDVRESTTDNIPSAEKIVVKAIKENIPDGDFKKASNEQLKKLLVNILANFSVKSSVDGETF